MSNTGQLANAIAHGAPFVIVASGGLYNTAAPASALVVAKDSPLRTAHDLEGKTCSVTALKDITQIGPTAWMQRNGADSSKTRFVEIPFAEVAAALDRGTIDAGMLAEPWLSSANGTTVRVLGYVFDAIAPVFVLSPWFSTADYYRQNIDLVRRFARAIYDTARWANGHHPETAAILAKYAKVDLAVLQRMNRSQFATSLDPAQLQPILTMMYKYGAIDKPLAAEAIVAK
jgi:NitT/TauT family transport system substrate-binding protein